jgi:hypothetical protein
MSWVDIVRFGQVINKHVGFNDLSGFSIKLEKKLWLSIKKKKGSLHH